MPTLGSPHDHQLVDTSDVHQRRRGQEMEREGVHFDRLVEQK